MNWVQCDTCLKWYHLVCLGLNTSDVDEDNDFYCLLCKPRDTSESTEFDLDKVKIEDLRALPADSPPCSPSVRAAADKAISEVAEAVAASSKERRLEAEKRVEAVEAMFQLETFRGAANVDVGGEVTVVDSNEDDKLLCTDEKIETEEIIEEKEEDVIVVASKSEESVMEVVDVEVEEEVECDADGDGDVEKGKDEEEEEDEEDEEDDEEEDEDEEEEEEDGLDEEGDDDKEGTDTGCEGGDTTNTADEADATSDMETELSVVVGAEVNVGEEVNVSESLDGGIEADLSQLEEAERRCAQVLGALKSGGYPTTGDVLKQSGIDSVLPVVSNNS